jgi:hypothetical protein
MRRSFWNTKVTILLVQDARRLFGAGGKNGHATVTEAGETWQKKRKHKGNDRKGCRKRPEGARKSVVGRYLATRTDHIRNRKRRTGEKTEERQRVKGERGNPGTRGTEPGSGTLCEAETEAREAGLEDGATRKKGTKSWKPWKPNRTSLENEDRQGETWKRKSRTGTLPGNGGANWGNPGNAADEREHLREAGKAKGKPGSPAEERNPPGKRNWRT